MASAFLDAYEKYWGAVRSEVCCSACLDCRSDGSCGLSGRICSLRAQLPNVVDMVFAVSSPAMDDYVAAVETRICARCPQQDSRGSCDARNHAACALYAYLPLVVSAIEEVPLDARRTMMA